MSRTKGWSDDDNARRLEDLQFMAATGETLAGATRRLGLHKEALWKWCDRNNHLDLFAQLAANAELQGGHGARRGRLTLGIR